MSYSRPPNILKVGTGLLQNPPPSTLAPAGVVPVQVDAAIASTSNLGVVQVGSGLTITPSGVLSATGGSSIIVNVTLTAVNYTALMTDYYIGATNNNITITLPLGILGKVYYIKNQVSGNITLQGTGGQTINTSASRTLGTQDGIIVVFDGSRWNVIAG